jgi:hypothetical protein
MYLYLNFVNQQKFMFFLYRAHYDLFQMSPLIMAFFKFLGTKPYKEGTGENIEKAHF